MTCLHLPVGRQGRQEGFFNINQSYHLKSWIAIFLSGYLFLPRLLHFFDNGRDDFACGTRDQII
jgi:hypothetical protein